MNRLKIMFIRSSSHIFLTFLDSPWDCGTTFLPSHLYLNLKKLLPSTLEDLDIWLDRARCHPPLSVSTGNALLTHNGHSVPYEAFPYHASADPTLSPRRRLAPAPHPRTLYGP